MLNWWLITKHLSEFLVARPELASNWLVYPGSKGTEKKYPCVEVQWHKEINLSIHRQKEGYITLWVDIWVNSDNVDFVEVYKQQFDAQNVIVNCLHEWSDLLLNDLNLSAKVECRKIAPEGATIQPAFGSRLTIIIKWRG